MKIKQFDYFTAMANIDSPYLYRVCLCDDSNYGHSGHISARIKLAKRCTVEELNKVKDCPEMFAFVAFYPDEIV